MNIEHDGLMIARMEAAELSALLRLSNYSYTDSNLPTFTGIFGAYKLTVKKRFVSEVPALSSPRSELQAAARAIAVGGPAPKSGQQLALGWVISTVRSTATPVPDAKRRARIDEALAKIITLPSSSLTISHLPNEHTTVAQAKLGGQEYLLTQISEGNLVSSSDLAKSWGITNQALGNRKRNGYVFGMKVNNQLWYPAALKTFETREVAERVCSALRTVTPIESLLLLSARHAELDYRTVAEALSNGMAAEVQAFLQAATASAGLQSS